jgi:glucokinase
MPKTTIALDLGATKTTIGIVDEHGQVSNSQTIPTPSHQGRPYFIKKLIWLIKPLINKSTQAIALGVAGQVDFKRQIAHLYPNFPRALQNFPLAKILKNKFQLPIFIDNDVHCFILAENIYGAGRKYNNIIGLTLGTGIGGGIIINKKLFRGYNNLAGEFGSITIDDKNQIRCSCGHYGHWESLASGTGLINLYQKLTGHKKTTFEIEKLAKSGDKNAKEAVKQVSHYLALGLANIINSLNPEIIIIGGGFANFKMIWPPMLQEVKKNLIQPQMQKTKIVKSQLGDKAILMGAALLTKK